MHTQTHTHTHTHITNLQSQDSVCAPGVRSVRFNGSTCCFACCYIRTLLVIRHTHTHTLPEETGRDFSCVVSSLVQIMIDPYFRSISGFEMLVQKEWVAMGHPFMTRNKLTVETPTHTPDDEVSVEAGLGLTVS